MSNIIPFSDTPPSFIVQYIHRLHIMTSSRNYFQILVKIIANIPSTLLNLIIERSYQDVLQIEEEEVVEALSGLQEENNNIDAFGSSRPATSNNKIILVDKMDGDYIISLGEYKKMI